MKKQKGFTLIELLVVIAIIGLLSTLAVISLNNARQKSRDAKRLSDIKQIQTALELYYNDNNGYPPAASAADESGKTLCNGTATGFDTAANCSGRTVYMNLVPSNPSPVDNTTVAGCGGTGYTYTSATATTYDIQYCLGATTNDISNTILHRATPGALTNP